MPCKLHYQGETFDTTALPATHKTPLLQSVFDFCRAWESGTEAFTIRTSGSTGTPKPIRLERRQMQRSAEMTAQALGLAANDRALVCLPTQYIAGRMMLVRGMVLGLELFLTEPQRNPTTGFPETQGFDFAALIPLQAEAILEAGDAHFFRGGKAIIIGGAPVSVGLEKQLNAFGCPVWATYGMTETVTHIALRRLEGKAASPHFEALPGVVLSQDERDCLQIKAPTTRGKTLTTNDRVRLLDERRFVWLGRADFVINSGGVKVQPENVEAQATRWLYENKHPGDVIATGLPDPQLGQKVVLVLEGNPLSEETQRRLFQSLRASLSRYEVPKEIYFLSEFPRTATRKIDRNEVRMQILSEQK